MCISRTNRDNDESASVHRTLGCLQDFDGGGFRRCLIGTHQPDSQLEGKLKSEPSSICCLTNLDLNSLLTHMLETCLLRELKKVFIV
ncbi:hypothetical protein D8674_040804 [Pyrus ussuriensis x Pyrus communis]|uniref:Uncharacterized protein n=1 Tax=Pyrus ussuriensis x Pyrus communis TaxID=2448454 RepID=A0A5N5FWU3_9ROSA|nr:hypothetical protein D8674_040804 [Pyrus ussuriensis x Pyrus communis]